MAIHFLLQKLHKLTHLSLTGIPAFRQPELQQFCRDPPKVGSNLIFMFCRDAYRTKPACTQNFNSTQQLAFCVYSGKGVAELRGFLTALFDHITEMNGTDDTEYEDDDEDDDDPYNIEDTPYEVEEDDEEGDEEEGDVRVQTEAPSAAVSQELTDRPPSHEFVFRRDRPFRATTIPVSGRTTNPQISTAANIEGATNRLNAQILAASVTPGPRRQLGQSNSMADILPIIESPPPSDVASNRSAGTNHSNGAGFFRTYQDGAPLGASSGNYVALTPDLNFAEIGHGRGTSDVQSSSATEYISRSGVGSISHQKRPLLEADPREFTPTVPMTNLETSIAASPPFQSSGRIQPHALSPIPIPTSLSLQSVQPRTLHTTWPHKENDTPPSPNVDAGDPSQEGSVNDERGRSGKRSFRDTLNIAEHYANSFFFGRSRSRAGGSSPRRGNVNGNPNHWR